MSAIRARIGDVRHQLLQLHKALADAERISIERVRGRLTGGDFLQLLINDPALGWLLALSGIIVRIDEWLEQDDAQDDEAASYLAEIRKLLAPGDTGEFQRRYATILQDSPEAVLAHAAVMRALGSPT